MSPSSNSPSASSPLARLPSEVQAAFARFGATRDAADLRIVIEGALRDFMPKRGEGAPPAPLAAELRLIEDLGFDSLAVAETVFFFEDLFKVTIQTQEITQLRTVGDLYEFVGRKIAAAPPPA